MIINPTLAMGWNSVFKADVNHLALSSPGVFSAGEWTTDIRLAFSADGLSWSPQKIRGDLTQYTKSVGGPGAFEMRGILRAAGAWWAYGAIRKTGGVSEGVTFKSIDGLNWLRVLTGFETSGDRPSILYGDGRGSTICLMKEVGGPIYSLDGGETWFERSEVLGTRGVFITSSGTVIVGGTDAGDGFHVKTASTPSGVFTDHGAMWGVKDVSVVARGNIVLGISIYNPSLGELRAAYAREEDVSSEWASADLDMPGYINRAFYAVGHWYAGSASGGWHTSSGADDTPGVGGWESVTPPWAGPAILNSGYERDGRAFAHFGLGQLAVSEDGEEWDVIESSGLEPVRYLVAAA